MRVVTTKLAERIGTWRVVVVSSLAGLLMAYGSSCDSPATGSSCATAGGTCVIGGLFCAKEAASSAQDCNTTPPNPGGAICCLALAEAGVTGVASDGGVDAGTSNDASAATDAVCTPVLASAYDQSCDADTDCVGVGEVPSCSTSTCACPTAAINKSANAQYSALFSQVTAAYPPAPCNCACLSGAICRSGTCQAAFCGPPTADTLPSCADAGGTCFYSANSTCNALGPPDACAYSDEVCCVQ